MDSLTLPSWNISRTPELDNHSHDFDTCGECVVITDREVLAVLQLAHDKMDARNQDLTSGNHCLWCKGPWGYDGNGIRHEEDCVLMRIRRLVVLV